MSSDSAASSIASYFPSGISITGGIPLKSQDLAASIVFTIVFALLIPPMLFRWVKPSSRTLVLIRPSLFIVVRVATYIIRAYMSTSEDHLSTGLFIAEQILLLVGFVFLCSAALALLGAHMMRTYVPTGGQQPLIQRAHKILELALLAAIILGIYSGTQLSGINTASQSTINTLKSCRDANVIICIVVSAGVALLSLVAYVQQKPRASLWASLYLSVLAGLLVMSSIYKIVIYTHPTSFFSDGAKAAFYCLSCLPEFLATAMLFAINLNDAYEIKAATQKEKDNKKMRKGQYQGAGYSSEGKSLREGAAAPGYAEMGEARGSPISTNV
ncbi:hypothetical protein MNV49_006678 [Pseudohyphozyma bogoriensis]|nr:hypothetical protein MNV49_006678 [Pseudohyphozyma bogoriensis]